MTIRIKYIFQIIGGGIVLTLLVLVGFVPTDHTVTKKCKNVIVFLHDSSANNFISSKDISALLRKSKYNPVGKEMHSIQTNKIESFLMNNHLLKNAECYKTTNQTICIELFQRIPLIRIMPANNITYYLDTEGEKMPTSINHTVNVPLASGYISLKFAKEQLFPFAQFLKENLFWNSFVGQIYVSSDHQIEVIPRVGKQEIILSSLINPEEELTKLFLFYEEGLGKLGWNRYTKINLKYKDQVVCTKNKKKQ